MLSKRQFLRQLRLEKRRTERFKGPLSIALFHFEHKGSDGLHDVRAVFNILRDGKRELDIAGYLEDDLIGIILPGTNPQGAREFAQKITERLNGLPCTATTATYPDYLFDNLTRGSEHKGNLDPIFPDDSADSSTVGYVLKRSLDVTGAIVAILLFAPVMLIAALAVKMSSSGPVIFRQSRLGQSGIPFDFYKFRSMYRSADDGIHREFVTRLIKGDHRRIDQQDASKPLYKIKSDPRVTRVGRIIRKTSIDELPQLFCVLKGDMSLVGPRPPLPYEAKEYEPWHLRRILEIKPGITGLWQVDGRSRVSFDDMVRMDLRYVRNCSLMFDLKILLKTFVVVVRREGAT